MNSILMLAMKDLRLLWRDRFGLFWVLGFPLLYSIFFGMVLGGGGGGAKAKMKVAIIDEDRTEASRTFIADLSESASLNVITDDFETIEAAREGVRTGKLVGFIVVGKGIGDMRRMFAGGEDGGAPIRMGIDPARSAEEGFLQGIVMECWFKGLSRNIRDPELMHNQIEQWRTAMRGDSEMSVVQRTVLDGFFTQLDTLMSTVDLDGGAATTTQQSSAEADSGGVGLQIEKESIARGDDGPKSFEITFPQAVIWGLMGCAATFAISIVNERRAGTLLRLAVSPLSPRQIIAGKGLACFLACSAVMVLLLILAATVFGLRIRQPMLLLVAIVCCALCFVGVMMLMSVLGKTEQSVAGAGWAIMIVMAMLGGGMIPLIAMPAWMQSLSGISPVSWAIYSVEGAVWRNFSLAEMVLPCSVLIGVGVVGYSAGVVLHRKQGL